MPPLSPMATFLGLIVDTILTSWAVNVVYGMWKDLKEVSNFRKELDEKISDQT